MKLRRSGLMIVLIETSYICPLRMRAIVLAIRRAALQIFEDFYCNTVDGSFAWGAAAGERLIKKQKANRPNSMAFVLN